MRVPDDVLKCVCFCAYEKKSGGRHLSGTAFFLAFQDDEVRSAYLVTARHIVETAREKGADGSLYLRVNTRDDIPSENEWLESNVNDWHFHPDDPRIDVAVLGLPGWEGKYDHKFYPVWGMATDDVIRRENIGAGDELWFPGLFVKHPGEYKNEPIVRFGNITAMPTGLVSTKLGLAKVYLAESRSVGGLSGSPVFAYIPSDRDALDLPLTKDSEIRLGGGKSYLLGLVHGHWDHVNSADETPFDPEVGDELVNMGIAIIVPITNVLDVINAAPFAAERQARKERLAKSRLPTMD